MPRYSVWSLDMEEWSRCNVFPEFPKHIDCDKYKIISGVNGLFCMSCDVGSGVDEYVLWKPSTNTFRLVPHPDLRNLPCASCSSRKCLRSVTNLGYGLGFVVESQDYKFVRFTRNHTCSVHVTVYSYKNNSWKEIPLPLDRFRGSIRFDTVDGKIATFVNGFCYWRISTDFIISFELSSEKFSALPYPHDITRPGSSSDVFLLDLDGSLGLGIRSESAETTKLFSFWVYESSSISSSPSPWTRKTNLDVHLAAEKPLLLCKKKNASLVLFLRVSEDALLEYNYATTELKKIDQLRCRTINIDDGGVDRISQLPDDIILTILSLISLKEAASTSVLSTRWCDLWKHIPNLLFHDADYLMMRDKPKYIQWVNSVVESHKALSLKEFNISFPLETSTQCTVLKCLEFAFSRGVEVLVLNLVNGRSFSFLENSFMQKISILKSTNLTSLCLKCMKVSGEAIRLFLCNCPLLERLIIKYAVLTSNLELCGDVLKHLDIQYCKGGKSIKGYAPNLTYLRIGSCRNVAWDYTQSFISSPLTTLEFTLPWSESFLEKMFSQIPTLRKFIIKYFEPHIFRAVTYLLSALPHLEEFEIKKHHYNSMRFYKKLKDLEPVNNVERFCSRHLKVFKFTWFNVGDSDHMELMNYILDNCVALQKIILEPCVADWQSHVSYWEYVKQLQSKLPSHVQLIVT